jgi:hypothetical protein
VDSSSSSDVALATVPVASTPLSTPPVGKYRKYIDVNYAKKNLFQTGPPLQAQEHLLPLQANPHNPPCQEDPPSVPITSKEYQKREDNLWARIFSKS